MDLKSIVAQVVDLADEVIDGLWEKSSDAVDYAFKEAHSLLSDVETFVNGQLDDSNDLDAQEPAPEPDLREQVAQWMEREYPQNPILAEHVRNSDMAKDRYVEALAENIRSWSTL